MLIRIANLILMILQANSAFAGPDQNIEGKLNTADSYFHVLVYSDGLLSGFGHDHVIAANNWQGQYQLNNEGQLQASLQFRSEDLIVDRISDRALYPHLADKQQPSKEDISDTKKNILSEALLDAHHHPFILARINADIKRGEMILQLTLGGHKTRIPVTYKINCKNDMMTTKGTFHIDHADLNLTPFSALLGAIKVAEAIDFAFSVSTPLECNTFAPI